MVVHGTYKSECFSMTRWVAADVLLAARAVSPPEGKGSLKVLVTHSVDDSGATPKPVVAREGTTGSFGFTTGALECGGHVCDVMWRVC